MRVQRLDPFEFTAAVALVIVLSVLVCAAFGAPTRSARAEVLRLGLDGLFAQARDHAVASGYPVVICPVGRAFHCNGASDWSRGWIGFIDSNGTGQFDGDDELLRRDLPLSDGLRLYALAGRSQIRFEPRAGRIVSGDGFVVCDPGSPDEPAKLGWSDEGRLRLDMATADVAKRCSLK